MRRLALLALLMLTACGTSDDTVEDLGDRIESDLKAHDGVSSVEVKYTTGVSGAEIVQRDEVKFALGDVVEMERRYGPRSEAGELEPGR